jgi:predicted nuclease with TOPRIM domain
MDSLAWAAVGAGAFMCSLGFATFWMNMQRQITEAKTEASGAGLRGVQANLKIDGLQSEISNFKLYAQKEFVNHDDLRAHVERSEAQFDNLREDLKGITSRLDRLLESRIPAAPSK